MRRIDPLRGTSLQNLSDLDFKVKSNGAVLLSCMTCYYCYTVAERLTYVFNEVWHDPQTVIVNFKFHKNFNS